MDPNTTWKELVLAIRRDDRREAREYATALREWIGKGGFLPTGVTRERVDEVISVALDPFGNGRDGVWRDCGEGPFENEQDAHDFAEAECGVEWRVIRRGREWVIQTWSEY